jgi:ribulose-5-phosphate 4-epimerase/fuculose-1-phosphate aldolase
MTDPARDQDLTAALHDLARACRILEMEGHGDMTLGHLSLRDPVGRGFWMKRNRIGLGEVMGPDDFVLVDWDGEKIAGTGGRHSEWPIHSEILRVRRTCRWWRTPIRSMHACSPPRSILWRRSPSMPTTSSRCRATRTRSR